MIGLGEWPLCQEAPAHLFLMCCPSYIGSEWRNTRFLHHFSTTLWTTTLHHIFSCKQLWHSASHKDQFLHHLILYLQTTLTWKGIYFGSYTLKMWYCPFYFIPLISLSIVAIWMEIYPLKCSPEMVWRLKKNEWLTGCKIRIKMRNTARTLGDCYKSTQIFCFVLALGGQKNTKTPCQTKEKEKGKGKGKGSGKGKGKKKLMWIFYFTQVFCVGADNQSKSISGIPENIFWFWWSVGPALLGDRSSCMVKLSYLNLEIKPCRWIYVYTIKVTLFRVHGSAKSVIIICNAVWSILNCQIILCISKLLNIFLWHNII